MPWDYDTLPTSLEEAELQSPTEDIDEVDEIEPEELRAETCIQDQEEKYSEFVLTVGVLLLTHGVDQKLYTAIRQSYKQLLASKLPQAEVESLPKESSTIKNWVLSSIPLKEIPSDVVALQPEKLPTERASRKSDEGVLTVKGDFYHIDPYGIFTSLLASDLAKRMHFGLAHFVDKATDLFHSHSWASSVRTTSGQYAHVIRKQTDVRGNEIEVYDHAVFPSDFVLYKCSNGECVCKTASTSNADNAHLGRIYGVGKDFRTDYCTAKIGDVALQIQEAFPHPQLRFPGLIPPHPQPILDQSPNELVLDLLSTFVPQSNLIARTADNMIVCNYFWGEDHTDPSPAMTRGTAAKKSAYPKYSHRPEAPQGHNFVCRGFIDGKVIPLCHTHPIRAELELATYGRKRFEQTWDRNEVVSCPIMVFIDGFGLYRNSYRSLVGVYAMIASLSLKDRQRPANVFPIALSPHGSNFNDAVRAMQQPLANLEMGVKAVINGKEVIVSVPTVCYLGDMPQQDKNSGFRGPKALKSCRFCYIGQSARKPGNPAAVLDFDVQTHGRYHHQVVEMRRQMDSLGTAARKKAYGSQWGLAEERPALVDLSPALDLVLSRPPDPAHSEFKGLTELMHALLLNEVLRAPEAKAYTLKLRTWPFPPGWGRLQSPLHHLRSYSLSDHARWSIIVPCLLRRWLQPSHLQPLFMGEARRQLNLTETGVVEYIVTAFAKLAKSNSVLMGSAVSRNDRRQIMTIVMEPRRMYQQLCICAARSIATNPRVYGSFGSRQASTRPEFASAGPSDVLLPSREVDEDDGQQEEPKRSSQLSRDMVRPNIHVGVHFAMIAEEYGLTLNVNVLSGEDRHR